MATYTWLNQTITEVLKKHNVTNSYERGDVYYFAYIGTIV